MGPEKFRAAGAVVPKVSSPGDAGAVASLVPKVDPAVGAKVVPSVDASLVPSLVPLVPAVDTKVEKSGAAKVLP